MNKKELSRLLKETGSSFKEFETEVKKQHKEILYGCGTNIIISSLVWGASKQGHGYWSEIHNYISMFHYPLTKDWKVGCQRLDKESRKLLFKVLAEDLGYEIEE